MFYSQIPEFKARMSIELRDSEPTATGESVCHFDSQYGAAASLANACRRPKNRHSRYGIDCKSKFAAWRILHFAEATDRSA